MAQRPDATEGRFLDSLRDTLRKVAAEPGPETDDLVSLKRILGARISELEAAQDSHSESDASPRLPTV